MSLGKQVLIIGPGFIGWNVLDLLVASGYTVTGLVRRKSHADQIEQSGATSITGDLNDHVLITRLTTENNIIIHTATADHLPSVEAVLEGLRRRAQAGKESIFFHTSGSSVLHDSSNGSVKDPKIYYDNQPSDLNALADDAPHRAIDLAIIKARQEPLLQEKAKIVLMIPPLIYGLNPAHKRLSIQVPTLARFALKNGFAGYVGTGLGVWSQIHVQDLARGYVILLHWLEVLQPGSPKLESVYFFCENGEECSWRDIATGVAQSLHSRGFIEHAEPKEIGKAMWEDLFGEEHTIGAVGLNSRSRAVRLKELGWRPREKGIWESWEDDELPLLLEEEDAGRMSRYSNTKG